ncbi:MAG: ATP-binding protein [Methylicorpusculum sp.]|uniref:ATP-binding protein n=1 Tax=Methylicorpusculum sp. TaxID=2713644 RepID=UPI0027162E97|nr:ATP-binding protein [Methylicorpusculum sp.]MDO8940860.1 ATP-binding protein [Methylicorpusculum sp.]MDP2202448.1 ATP-binding protein [Methylicorpusculum sp.]
MRHHYVKTSNHTTFMDLVDAVENRAAREARILLLAGEPGTGKSRCVDHFGAERNAIHIEGMPGMSVAYLRELLAYELDCAGGTKFQQQKAIQEAFAVRRPTVILDEAQHGLDHKAECIEFLRRVCEQAGSLLVLVCHTSEKHRFGEHKLAHIATRISALVEFSPAHLGDTALYLRELCEVAVDDAVIKQALAQSRGRYRLLSNACRILEDLAQATGKSALTGDDVKGAMLCEDAMKSLRKGGK